MDSPEERRAAARLRKSHPGSPPIELKGKQIESSSLTPKAQPMPPPPPRPQKPPLTKEDDDADVAAIRFDDEDAAAGARRVKKALTVLADAGRPSKTRAAVAEALATVLSGDSEASRGCLRLNGAQAGVDLLPGGASLAFLRRAQRARGYTVLCWVREARSCTEFTAAKIGRCHVVVTPVRESGSLEWRAEVNLGDGRRKTAGGRSVDDGGDNDLDDGGAGHSNENEDLAPRWRLLAVSHAQKYLSPAEVQVSVDGLAVGGPVAAQLPTADSSIRISVLDGFEGVAASIALLEGAASLKALRGAFWRGPRGGPGAAAGAFRRGEQHGESDDEDETQASLAKLRVACAVEPGPLAASNVGVERARVDAVEGETTKIKKRRPRRPGSLGAARRRRDVR